MMSGMRRLCQRSLVCAGATAVLGDAIFAQGGGVTTGTLADRLQALVARGETHVARRVVDSILVKATSSEPEFGVALYWRATLVTTPDSARRDLLRVVVEYPYAPYMEDALIRLADHELRAGDHASARRHLERLVRDNLSTDRGARAAHQLAQMLLDDGETLTACDVLDSARAHSSRENVELANQIDYTGRTCAQARAARQAPPDGRLAGAQTDSTGGGAPQGAARKEPGAKGTTSPPSEGWSVQVAAYAARADALRLVARLSARGYAARVTATKPYRVRIGRFATREEAGEIAARLKAENTTAIVVEAEHP